MMVNPKPHHFWEYGFSMFFISFNLAKFAKWGYGCQNTRYHITQIIGSTMCLTPFIAYHDRSKTHDIPVTSIYAAASYMV
jgi:hypothetical protein